MNRQHTDINYIRRYVNGELSSKEMYELEHAAQADEMIMDIIMGVEFEKSHDLPDHMDEIRRRIRERALRTKTPSRTFPWAGWSVAATIALSIGVASYIFLSRQRSAPETTTYRTEVEARPPVMSPPIADTPQTSIDRTPRHSNPGVTPSKVLSSKLAAAPTDTSDGRHNTLAYAPGPETDERVATSRPEKYETALKVATLSSPQDTPVGVVSSRHILNPPAEEIRIAQKLSADDSAKLANGVIIQALDDKNAHAKVEPKIHSSSPEQLRAKLVHMHIDPQTSMLLNRVIDQQSREQMDQMARAENKKSDLDRAEHNYTYLANIKSRDHHPTKERADGSTESIQGLSFSKQESSADSTRSIPVGGWKALDDYLGQALAAHDIRTAHVTFEFKLDDRGRPQEIRIVHSDNKEIDPILTEMLRKGPLWKPGSDVNRVKLEIKF